MLGMCFTFQDPILQSFLLHQILALPQLQAICQTLKLARDPIGLLSWTTIHAAMHYNCKLSKVKFKMSCN